MLLLRSGSLLLDHAQLVMSFLRSVEYQPERLEVLASIYWTRKVLEVLRQQYTDTPASPSPRKAEGYVHVRVRIDSD